MITIREIDSYQVFLGLRTDWNGLLRRSGNDCVFLTWEWARTWLDVYQRGDPLCVLMGYGDSGELVGIAPLVRRRLVVGGMKVRSLDLIGGGSETTPDHMGFIADREAGEGFVGAVFEHLYARREIWDVVRLKDMDDDDAFRQAVGRIPQGRLRFDIAENGRCPYIHLPVTWDDYLSGLTRKSRYNIGKKERNLAARFRVDFEFLTDGAAVREGIRTLSDLHRRRMLVKRLDGVTMCGKFWEFHERVASVFSEKGWLALGVLKADGRVVACQYGFCYGGRLYHYQSGIDPEFSKYSVGLISTARMIRDAIGRGLSVYDFLRGEEEYKFHLTQTSRRNIEVYVWNDRPLSVLLSALHYGKLRLKRLRERSAARAALRGAMLQGAVAVPE